MISLIAELDSGTKVLLGMVFVVVFSYLCSLGESHLRSRLGQKNGWKR